MHSGFHGIVDYAGLFPPASCEMDEAVANFAEYFESPDSWMLGRFIVAGRRLEEFTDSVQRLNLNPTTSKPWGVSVVFGVLLADEMVNVDKFRSGPLAERVIVEAVETQAQAPGAVSVIVSRLPGEWDRFLEVPRDGDHDLYMKAMAESGAMAKLRTGGIRHKDFPSPAQVARFLSATTKHSVPFKFTAGLHHPWRGDFPLTYEHDAERTEMFGFVPMLVATASLLAGGGQDLAESILEETDPKAFVISPYRISWHDMDFGKEVIERARQLAFRAFGSCSFREPVDELELGAPK